MTPPGKNGGIHPAVLIAGLALLAGIVIGAIYYAGDGMRWLGNAFGIAGLQDAPVERVFDLTIEGGRVAGDMQAISVRQGDWTRLRWTTDAPIILHLHGYDVEMVVQPGALAEFGFTAHATGRFPISVHQEDVSPEAVHDEVPLLLFEVYPR